MTSRRKTSHESDSTWNVEGCKTVIPKILVIWLRRQQGTETYYWRAYVPQEYRDLNGGRRYVGGSLATADPAEAEKKAIKLYHKTEAAWENSIPIRKVTVDAAIRRYLKDVEARKTATDPQHADDYVRHQKKGLRHFQSIYGKHALVTIGDQHVEDYFQHRAKIGKAIVVKGKKQREHSSVPVSQRTIEWEISIFKSFLRWARQKKLTTNEISFKSPSSRHATRNALTEAQWDTLVRYMRRKEFLTAGKWKNDKRLERHRHMLRAYVLFMANIGLRVGEARHLRWRDCVVKKEGDKEYLEVYVSPQRSKVRKPRFAIGRETAVTALVRWKAWRVKQQDFTADEDFVFCNEKGAPIGDMRDGFNRLISAANVAFDTDGKKHTLYSLRHTYITFRLKHATQVQVHEVAANCGTSVHMIEKYYGHVGSRDFVRALIS